MQLSSIEAQDRASLRQPVSGRHGHKPNVVYIMLKPPPTLAETLCTFPETARDRAPELLHITVQPVGDRSWLTDADLAACRAALDGLRQAPFWTGFGKIEAGNSSSLQGSKTDNKALRDFHLAVTDHLRAHFPWLPAYRMHPHMTLNYRPGQRGRLLAQPVGWMVDEFLLVESVQGEGRHVEWGRWRLHTH